MQTQPGQWGLEPGVGVGVGVGVGGNASHQAAWSDPAQRAQQQAQRLYQQQLMQQQEQYRSQQLPSMHNELNAVSGEHALITDAQQERIQQQHSIHSLLHRDLPAAQAAARSSRGS